MTVPEVGASWRVMTSQPFWPVETKSTVPSAPDVEWSGALRTAHCGRRSIVACRGDDGPDTAPERQQGDHCGHGGQAPDEGPVRCTVLCSDHGHGTVREAFGWGRFGDQGGQPVCGGGELFQLGGAGGASFEVGQDPGTVVAGQCADGEDRQVIVQGVAVGAT